MEYFETPEQVSQQLDDARQKLERFAESAPSDQLMARLAAAQPYHVTLVMRRIFLAGTAISLATTGLLIVAPHVLEKSSVAWMSQLEGTAFGGAPLPVVSLTCAFCMFVAWMMSSQAAIAYAKECPLLPHEKKEQERLLGEYTRLSGQKAIMERLRGTPMGAAARANTPVTAYGRPVTPVGTAARTTSPQEPPRSNLIERALGGAPGEAPPDPGRITGPAVRGPRVSGTVARPQTSSAPVLRPSTAVTTSGPVRSSALSGPVKRADTTSGEVRLPSSGVVRRAPSRAVDEIQPTTRAGVPLGAAPMGGASAIGRGRIRDTSGEAPPPPTGTPAPVPDASQRATMTPEPSYDREATPPAGAFALPDIVDAPGAFLGEPDSSEQASATEFPHWGAVTEPWLEDAIQRAESLARAFPMQAHLEFSPEENLPFVLVLERATPAMAQRCMVSYVEFLAAIATPPRARIEFRSVATMDPAFYRSVTAALEPFFGEAAEVTRDSKTKRVEIDFLEPDVGWKDYLYLPIAG